MLFSIVILHFILFFCNVSSKGKNDNEGSPTEDGLKTQLRHDANLNLSVDEEYEDLRAELLAYHTALASLSSTGGDENARKSMLSTPCWQLNGICVNHKLCTGFRFLTEVPGCKDKHKVCCFTWNRYQVRDMRDEGLGTLALPWQAVQHEFGGEGILSVEEGTSGEENTKFKRRPRPRPRPRPKPTPRPKPATKNPKTKKTQKSTPTTGKSTPKMDKSTPETEKKNPEINADIGIEVTVVVPIGKKNKTKQESEEETEEEGGKIEGGIKISVAKKIPIGK